MIGLSGCGTQRRAKKLEEMGYITRLDFANDNENLLSNGGVIDIKKKSIMALTPNLSSDQSLMIKDNWIQRDNRNFLWLPQEYREGRSAFYNNAFAFGLHSGQVSILQFLD